MTTGPQQGPGGDKGPTGDKGPPGDKGLEGNPAIMETVAKLIVPTAAIILLVLAATIAFFVNDYRQLISENRDQIERIQRLERAEQARDRANAQQRAENRERFQMTDLQSCHQIEKLKETLRAEAKDNRRELERNLRELGIPLTARVRAIADEELAQTLERHKAREAGCRSLPSLRTRD